MTKYAPQELQQMISSSNTTHPAAQPSGYSPSTKPRPKGTRTPLRVVGECDAKCAGGNPCCADSKHRHQIHCCNDANCKCREILRGNVSTKAWKE